HCPGKTGAAAGLRGARGGAEPAGRKEYATALLPQPHSRHIAMRGNPDARQGAIALHGFYFLYYGLQGVSIPFLPLWFASRGLDPTLIGLIVATSFRPMMKWSAVVAHVDDHLGGELRMILSEMAASLLQLIC
ncbi:MFS transporter, partial [Stenotrophomonas maltophilia]|uniref:MFS transporter n=1 Tax=Stenotrophomonas maltophilia TaxID=40324 RepID=UPI00296F868C